MKFTVGRKVDQSAKVPSRGGVQKHDYLQMAAHAGRLDLAVEDFAGTSLEATVERTFVIFITQIPAVAPRLQGRKTHHHQ